MAEALWTIDELAGATGGTVRGEPAKHFNGVSIDSRTVARGDIFVAIKGERQDGHDFVVNALRAGAGIAIVSRPTADMEAAGPLLVVDDPLAALENMGRAARGRSLAQIIAVTGSVGKTSTKELLNLALAQSGLTHASAASFNNHWGVPLTLARVQRECAFGVFEIGMNHAGEITPLTRMVRPHVAIVTAVAASHLGHFASLAEIADAKSEIFLGLEPGGTALINRDSEFYERLAAAARKAGCERIIGFGRNEAAEIRLERVALHSECSCVTASILGETIIYKLGIPGEHHALNSLAVLGAVKLVGADLARAALALATAAPAKGRGVRFRLMAPSGEFMLIDESYNANPASMRAALALLANAKTGRGGRRIAVLGDMLELGEQGPQLHAELAGAVDEARVDVLYACGPLMGNLWEKTPGSRRGAYAETSDKLKDALLDSLRGGDVVMIKGSLGSRMGPIVEAIKSRFPEARRDS
ncbi:MAG: UDP-N-acetylmuramoylalanyl-D-glutamyl-2,6-diaminopimelate--D-alanyl-D-alanine ligase [Rhizobiales bacterium]|nr:UDP-N-acetylmuramoylalanyl-D-glutamyl-2,6-diaminopimelate--D-alanyl-D-alanine ligase [Hyphomicrobiales bacterium]